MISVFIVDDEYLIRNLIINSVDWDALDMEVVGQAGDGETALTMIESLRPQIVLLDINIPFYNGLEVAKAIHEGNLGAGIIFLTGYREFSYAQDAISCQAFGYLLKPLAPGELTSALKALGEKIRMEQAHQSYLGQMERQNTQGRQLLKERALHRLAFGTVPIVPQQLEKNFQELDITLEPHHLMVLCMEFDLQDDKWEPELYTYAVLNMLCEHLESSGVFPHIETLSEVDSSCIVVCNVIGTQQSLYAHLRTIWAELEPAITAHLPALPTIAVSPVFHDFDQVRKQVNQAMQAMDGKFYNDKTNLFFPGTDQDATANPAIASINFEQLQRCMDMGDAQTGRIIIVTLFENMRKQSLQRIYAKMMALGLVAMMDALDDTNGQHPADSPNAIYLDRIKAATSFEGIERNLLAYYDHFFSAVTKSKRLSKIVLAAQAYIRESYSESGLSLKNVAASVFSSPAYVSSLFKRETNLSVTEYITICRMNRAAELLCQEEGISFSAVAEQVGYVDPYYFSRCFKKHYGLTPSKFLLLHAQDKSELTWNNTLSAISPSDNHPHDLG